MLYSRWNSRETQEKGGVRKRASVQVGMLGWARGAAIA
jgi:hypothetical protein